MTYNSLESLFAAICTAIRGQEGSTGTIKHQAIPERIAALSGNGSVHGLSLSDIHIWKKTEATQRYELKENKKTDVVLSYYNPANADSWDKVTYSDSIKVAESEVQLINGTELVLETEGGGDVLKGKYIYAAYTGKYYRIPEDAVFTLVSPTYGTTKRIEVSTAQELTVTVTEIKGGTLVGYVVSASKENYPENGNADDGYSYEYIGTCDYELAADSLADIHIWERRTATEKYAIKEAKKTDVRISYTSNLNGSGWNEVSYANAAEVIDSAITLVNPITITLDGSADRNALLGKYIYTTYDGKFYRIPKDATITRSSGTYYGSIDASTAYELSVTTSSVTGGKLVGYVVSADREKYPENGNTSDGYKYVYIGTAEGAGSTEDVVEQATPTITVSATGLITAESAQAAGRVVGGTKTATKQLSTQVAKTYTPGIEDQEIQSGRYLTGKQIIKGDSNLVPENIKSGVTIFGKTGTHKCPEVLDTSDATASAADITKNKTAYINGEKVTGTHECESDGIDTSDATATPEDMAEGATAYANGEKITGNLRIISGSSSDVTKKSVSWQDETKQIRFETSFSDSVILKKGGYISIKTDAENFGDATAEDVVAGKTFTSENGLKVIGTHECPETLDTSDATATAEDIVKGTSAYVNGEKIEGSLIEWGGSEFLASKNGITWQDKNKQIQLETVVGTRTAVKAGGTFSIKGYATEFGDAEAADVAEGKTFTSSAGLKVTGTKKETSNSVALPELTNPGTASDVTEGVEFVDANGNIVTGTLKEGKPEITSPKAQYNKSNIGTSTINLISCVGTVSKDVICRAGQEISIGTSASDFGDATASDVTRGKTFTSASGLKITGTREDSSSSGSNIETFRITSADTVITPTRAGAVQVWGYGINSSSSFSRTTYSFVGDGYYSGTSYGTPSKTSATFGIGDDGKVTGLPTGLTSLDILVVIE